MTRTDPRRDSEAQTDGRYAGFDIEDGYVLYDTENRDAWIQSDTALGPREVR